MSVYKGIRYSRLGVNVLEVDVVQNTIYTVATVPNASDWEGVQLYVQDGAEGNPVMAFSDGTNWLRCDNLQAISED
jgi:hypothetical protein